MASRSFAAGETLFRAGDSADRAYLIESGQVEILAGTTRVALLGPGEVVGEMALIEERAHGKTARAAKAGSATSLTRAEFEHDLLHDPSKCRQYLIRLFERLRTLSEKSAESPTVPAVSALKVTIHPLTRKAAETLPDAGLPIEQFPFRIGRASEAAEREAMDLNDLWLLDTSPFNVSRNHLAIDFWDGSQLIVKDRGSVLGTIVNEVTIGGRHQHRTAPLVEGDNVLILGGPASPYQFRIEVVREA
ncbi:MAG: cyclic nucleotide-binding domain-containing protein [Gemmataceae bacterium]